MKCEICHKNDAKTALPIEKNGEEDELYVCEACAKAERQKKQKRGQRTRRVTGLPPGMEMSVTEFSSDGEEVDGDNPPPILGAIMGAVAGMFGELGEAAEQAKKEQAKKDEMVELPCSRAAADYRIGEFLHLEGLHLIGELEAVKRALRALRMELAGISSDGVNDVGHIYRIMYSGPTDRAKRVAEDILREERNARVRLREEMPRIFGDALCRALAILKNCRLLSPGELFDLLSPLRLAAREKMLDGITFAQIEKLTASVNLTSEEDSLEPAERDRLDAERADKMNDRFEDVMLNEPLEGRF